MQRRTILTAAVTALAAASGMANAQDTWPSKPITYVVPFGPGGTTDVLGRLVTSKAGPALGTTFVIENKPGTGGSMGTEFTSRAAPDGYTIQGGTISSHAINVSLYTRLPYDPVKNFQPITMIGSMPNVLVVRADSPFKSVQDVVAAAKSKPGSINYASSGNGTSQHLSGVFFEQKSGGKLVHVPYKSSAESLNALLSGQGADMIFENLAPALPHIKAGKLRALAVTADKRLAELPDVPTVKELGIKGLEDFTYATYTGLFGPAKMPPDVLRKLNDAMVKVVSDPARVKKFADLSADARPSTPEALAAVLDREDKVIVPLIRKLGIKAE